MVYGCEVREEKGAAEKMAGSVYLTRMGDTPNMIQNAQPPPPPLERALTNHVDMAFIIGG